MTEREFTIAVIGATGAVGTEVLRTLEERLFPVGDLRLFASERSAGELLDWRGGSVRVEKLDGDGFAGVLAGTHLRSANSGQTHPHFNT